MFAISRRFITFVTLSTGYLLYQYVNKSTPTPSDMNTNTTDHYKNNNAKDGVTIRNRSIAVIIRGEAFRGPESHGSRNLNGSMMVQRSCTSSQREHLVEYLESNLNTIDTTTKIDVFLSAYKTPNNDYNDALVAWWNDYLIKRGEKAVVWCDEYAKERSISSSQGLCAHAALKQVELYANETNTQYSMIIMLRHDVCFKQTFITRHVAERIMANGSHRNNSVKNNHNDNGSSFFISSHRLSTSSNWEKRNESWVLEANQNCHATPDNLQVFSHNYLHRFVERTSLGRWGGEHMLCFMGPFLCDEVGYISGYYSVSNAGWYPNPVYGNAARLDGLKDDGTRRIPRQEQTIGMLANSTNCTPSVEKVYDTNFTWVAGRSDNDFCWQSIKYCDK